MNKNKLIRVLQIYPFITQIMYIFGVVIIYESQNSDGTFLNILRSLSDLLMNLGIVPIYPIILTVFNIIMVIVVIILSVDMMKEDIASVEPIKIALEIKKKHRIIFVTFIISIIITIRIFILCFWLYICGVFMIAQSGIIGCVGFIKDYKKNNLTFDQMIHYMIIQFVPFVDVRFDAKYIRDMS